ncbi:DUF6438 domain-containing protein [Sphingomonas arvum]|uniref:DUF6438 domain-containing protein n=1 Tax=Sphingomonas arvum TaxID=2992113 RepID=UPI0038B2B195
MIVRVLGAALIAGAATACTSVPPLSAPESVTLEVGPCHGHCPVYQTQIEASGAGWFKGERNTYVVGTSPLKSSPQLYRQLEQLLTPLQPKQGQVIYDQSTCRPFATDQSQLRVVWSAPGHAARELNFDLGCHDPRYAVVRARLEAALRLLPISDLIRSSNPRKRSAR